MSVKTDKDKELNRGICVAHSVCTHFNVLQ